MAEHNEFRLGAYSGLLAVIMVVALSVMAFAALDPGRAPPLRMAQIEVMPDLPHPQMLTPIPKPIDG